MYRRMRIGDRVKVKNKLSSYFGIMGTIEEYCGGGFHVKLDDNEKIKRIIISKLVSEKGRNILVVGPNVWGKGTTGDRAIKNAKVYRSDRVVVYDAPTGVWVDRYGMICYEAEENIKELMRGVLA